jgi:hypothetical protein
MGVHLPSVRTILIAAKSEINEYRNKSSNCRIDLLHVGGGDTAHGRPPRLVSPPTGDNLKCTLSGCGRISNFHVLKMPQMHRLNPLICRKQTGLRLKARVYLVFYRWYAWLNDILYWQPFITKLQFLSFNNNIALLICFVFGYFLWKK